MSEHYTGPCIDEGLGPVAERDKYVTVLPNSSYKLAHLVAGRYLREQFQEQEAGDFGTEYSLYSVMGTQGDAYESHSCALIEGRRAAARAAAAPGAVDLDWKREAMHVMGTAPSRRFSMQKWPSASLADAVFSQAWLGAERRRAIAPETRRKFSELADQWRTETAFTSSVSEMAMNDAYQKIIGMGKAALPLILRELEREPDHWFWALRAITRENPVPPEDMGDVEKMADAWLRLARERDWF